MDTVKVDFLIDNPTRELTIAVCIKQLLEREAGFKVSIDHQDPYNKVTYYDFLERTKGESDVIVSPNYNVGRMRNLLARGVRQNAKIIINHSEQLFPQIVNEEKLNTEYKKEYNRHVDGHIVWGESFAKRLIETAEVPKDKIYIAGNPKLDLAQRQKKIRKNKSEYKTIVLIVSDFSLGDYSDKKWEEFKKTYGIESNEPVNRHYKEARRRCVEWVGRAADRYQEVLFLMRTHPGEDRSPYRNIKKKTNIKITGDDEFSIDLGKADIIFEYTSSSIFESLIQNKPVYNLHLMDQTDAFYSTYSDLFEWVDEGEFNELINKELSGEGEEVKKERFKKINSYMWNPEARNITQSAIAIGELSVKCKSDNSSYSLTDKIISLAYILTAISKTILLRFGFYIESCGVYNGIYEYARDHWRERIRGKDYISNRMVQEANKQASRLLEREDFRVIKNKEYNIREDDIGIFVDLK